MATSSYAASSGTIALSASSTKSLWLLSAGYGAHLTELSISFDQSAASTAVRVDLYRATTVGSAAGTAGTYAAVASPSDPSTADTLLVNLTVEPTTVELLRQWYLQPAGGTFVLQTPSGREPTGQLTTARLGLRVVTPASVTPNAISYFEWAE